MAKRNTQTVVKSLDQLADAMNTNAIETEMVKEADSQLTEQQANILEDAGYTISKDEIDQRYNDGLIAEDEYKQMLSFYGHTNEENSEIQPASEDDYSALAAKFDNKEIVVGALKDHVVSGFITREQFASITGEDYEPEHHGRAETLVAMRDDLKSRIANKETPLSLDAAMLLIAERVKAKEISESDAAWLKHSLQSNAAADPKKTEIEENYKPANLSLEDAVKFGHEVALEFIDNDVETKTTRVSRLTLAFADIAYHLMKANQLPVSTKIYQTLWSAIVSKKLLGEPEGLNDPYKDTALKPYINLTAKKACLLAYGVVTTVTFGAVEKRHNPRGRLDRKLIFDAFDAEKHNGVNGKDWLRAVCLPANKVQPYLFMNKPAKEVKEIDGKKTSIDVIVAELGDDNTDSTLRMLPDEVADALYLYYFDDNYELEYDYKSYNTNVVPTGWISGAKVPSVATTSDPNNMTTGRDTGGSQETKPSQEAKIDLGSGLAMSVSEINQKLRDGAFAQAAVTGDLISTFGTIAAVARDSTVAIPDNAQLLFWQGATAMFTRRIKTMKTAPNPALARQLTTLLEEISGNFVWCNAKGEPIVAQDGDHYAFETVEGTRLPMTLGNRAPTNQ